MRKTCKKVAAMIMAGTIMLSNPSIITVNDTNVEAHGGRTDSSGGHKDNKNVSGLGSYHYHCGGNPAHLHDGGVCPYSSSSQSSNITATSGGGLSTNIGSSGNSSSNTVSKPEAKLSTGERITVSSDLIKIIQDVLNQKGYDCGTADGIAGTKTKKAIKDFLDETDEDDSDHMIISMVAEGMGI